MTIFHGKLLVFPQGLTVLDCGHRCSWAHCRRRGAGEQLPAIPAATPCPAAGRWAWDVSLGNLRRQGVAVPTGKRDFHHWKSWNK